MIGSQRFFNVQLGVVTNDTAVIELAYNVTIRFVRSSIVLYQNLFSYFMNKNVNCKFAFDSFYRNVSCVH